MVDFIFIIEFFDYKINENDNESELQSYEITLEI